MIETKILDIYSIEFLSIIKDKKDIPDKYKLNIYIENSDVIIFENLNFIDIFHLNRINYDKYIYFKNCIFNREIKFIKSNFNQISFINSVFKENLIVDSGNFNSFFWFEDCSFVNHFIIRNGKFQNFFFNNSEVIKDLRIEGGSFAKAQFVPKSEKDIIKITGILTFIHELEIKSSSGINFFAEKTFINKILCKGNLNNNSRINFNDIRNNFSVEFDSVKNDGKIYLNSFSATLEYPIILNDKNINIIDKSIFNERTDEFLRQIKNSKVETVSELHNKIETPNFIKEKIIEKYFSEITEFGKKVNSNDLFFKINNSSIGYIEFIDFELEQYKNINIESSDLSSIKLINSFFPVKKNKISSLDKTYLNHYSIYNDLYVSAKNQNNIKDRNKYFQASQKYLLKNLKTNFFKNLPSIISNLISRFFSNYGQSWIQSLIVTLLLSTLFFGLFLLSFQNLEFDLSYDGWVFFKVNYLKYLPEFINPTHKIDLIDSLKNKIGDWTRFFDFFGRIIVGIGIYETIKSFRKYVS